MKDVKRLLVLEGVFDAGTYVNGPKARGGFIHVSLSIRSCRECCAFEGLRSVATRVLHQQDPG